MAYADFNFYSNSYYGDLLTSTNANKWLELASDEIDRFTFGRLVSAFPTATVSVSKVKKAVCAIAEALYNIDVQRKAVSATKAGDGTCKGAIASVSSGRESISYSVSNASASIYAAAAASEAEHNRLISDIAVKYLANIEDNNGINLLYAGEVRYVPENNNTV